MRLIFPPIGCSCLQAREQHLHDQDDYNILGRVLFQELVNFIYLSFLIYSTCLPAYAFAFANTSTRCLCDFPGLFLFLRAFSSLLFLLIMYAAILVTASAITVAVAINDFFMFMVF